MGAAEVSLSGRGARRSGGSETWANADRGHLPLAGMALLLPEFARYDARQSAE